MRVPLATVPLLLTGVSHVPRAGIPVLVEDSRQGSVSDRPAAPGFTLPFLNRGVPEDQQPVMELNNLRQQKYYDWPESDEYQSKLVNLYGLIMLFASLPISYTTFYNLPAEIPQLILAANMGTFPVMIAFVLRLRVGWGFVSQRLSSNKIYYEDQQTGLIARKDKETRMRDKLIRQNEVSPVLERINSSLLALVGGLIISLASGEALTIALGDAGPVTLKTVMGDDARRFDNRLKFDDDFAREEQRRAQSRGGGEDGTPMPTYCNSRYYKILAGGNSQGGVGCGGSY